MAQPERTLDADPGAEIDRYAWVILLVVFLMSVAAPLNMAKVPPLMPVLRAAFALDLEQAGALMSVFAITGLILALPTGFIMQRLGPKVTGLIAMICLVTGAGLGAIAPSPAVLLGSRVVEGIGMGLITVVAPAIIAMWFPREKQGVPMGLWATWVPVGNVLMYNLSPAISQRYGWQTVWWGGAGFALVALVLFAWLMRMPEESEPELLAEGALPAPEQPGLRTAMLNPSIWLLALSFGFFNLVFLAFGTFFPTFLNEVRGLSLGQAAFVASISTMVVLVSAPLAGWLSDRLGTRRWLIIVASLLAALLLRWAFRVDGWQLYAFMIVLGLVIGAIPTSTFAAVPEVMATPALAGIGMAILSVGQNAGMTVGPVLFGKLFAAMGWVPASNWLLPLCALAAVAAYFVKVR